jgi:hypothetical protein
VYGLHDPDPFHEPVRPDQDPLPDDPVHETPGIPDGSWERNWVHQSAGVLVVAPPVPPPAVGATVGRTLGRLGTRFSGPLMLLPLIDVEVEGVGGRATTGREARTPWRAEPTPCAQVCAAEAAALASRVRTRTWALVFAVMAAWTMVWIAEVS